jgi:hypothetical protein
MGRAMKIDVLCGEPHFIDHAVPVLLALPEAQRGDLIVWKSPHTRMTESDLIIRAVRRGVLPVTRLSDEDRPTLVTSWGDHQRVRRHRTRIARMEHGIGQSFIGSDDPSYAGGKDAEGVGLFIVPNKHSADRWRRAYPQASVAIVGSPKLDTLPARLPGPGPVVATSFHWSAGLRGPLAETNGSFSEYRNSIAPLAKAFSVIGHGHPRALLNMAGVYRRAGIPVIEDFEDVCRMADVYVCDTNSTLYEFASTGRPVVVVNGNHFRRDVEHGLRFWDAASVGVQCDRPADLVAAIHQALEDVPEQRRKREAALDLVYAYRTGAAARAASALVAWSAGLELQEAA